ncbi:MAG: hypothetical protein K0R90_1325 [Oscillospiraceae bacterium]|jgi:hypothetical protein|nr:hypothetical protein [Oscillospiraceae bacterium]
MDIFREHLVKKSSSTSDIIKKIGIVILAVILFLFFFGLSFILPRISFILVAASIGVAYGAYFLITGLNVEYEYILTNGEIDVDKITAQRKRKRLITVHAKTFDEFGIYRPEEHANRQYDNRILSFADLDSAYYAAFKHPTFGNALLIFNPDERILNGVKAALSKNVKTNIIEQDDDTEVEEAQATQTSAPADESHD